MNENETDLIAITEIARIALKNRDIDLSGGEIGRQLDLSDEELDRLHEVTNKKLENLF